MISTTKIQTNFLVLYFLVVLNVFNLTPLQIIGDLFLIFLSIVGVFILIRKGIKRTGKKYYSYLLVFSLIAVISVISSNYFLDQPFLSGIIAIRPYLMIFSCIYPLELLTRRNMKLRKVINLLLKFVWIYFFYLLLIAILGVHYQIVSPISGQILEVDPSKASEALINFGVFLYLSKFIQSGRYKNLLWMILLYSANHFVDIQRGSLIIFLAILIFGIIKVGQVKARFKFFVLVPVVSVLLLLFALKNPTITSDVKQKFSQVFLLFDDSNRAVTDASIFIRLNEINFAWGHFLQSPIIGKGVVRSSQKDQIFEDQYFFYTDIGIISVLFAFGLVGLLVFGKSVRDVSKINTFYLKRSIPILTIYLFCSSLILLTLSRGLAILKPLQFVFFISVIYLEINKSKMSSRHNQTIFRKNLYPKKSALQK